MEIVQINELSFFGIFLIILVILLLVKCMYYINSFLIYSVLGFLLESTWYKILSIDSYSGFLFGPFTPVYGFGVLCILIIDHFIIQKISCHKIVKIIISFFIFAIMLSLIEMVGGLFLEHFLGIEMWNYSNKQFNFGKYACLELSLVWGIGSVIFIYIVKPFMDRFIKKIPKKATLIFLGILYIDFIASVLRYKGVI